MTIIVIKLVLKFYAVAKISHIYCWSVLIWATLYNQQISAAAAATVQRSNGLTEYRVEMPWTHYDTERCRERLDVRTGQGTEKVMRSIDRE